MSLTTETAIDQPSELLDFLRDSDDCKRQQVADQLKHHVLDIEASAPCVIRRPKRNLGSAGISACLLAYHEVMTYDSQGSVTGLARNVAEATVQLREIYDFTLRFDVARSLSAIYAKRWPNTRAIRMVLPLLEDVDGPADEFKDRKRVDVQVVRRPGATATFVVFCGLGHTFGIPINVLHHCCLAKHKTNVVYLRDLSGAMYLRGVSSLGDVSDTCGSLRSLFSEMNTRKLVFIGNSAGAFASLYYGSLLDADSVLLFGGPTSLEIGAAEVERQVFARVHKLRSEGVIEWPNLREIYAQRSTSVSAYFASENRVDRLQAENLQGLRNVELYPIETQHHVVLGDLAKTGELNRIFAAAAARPKSSTA